MGTLLDTSSIDWQNGAAFGEALPIVRKINPGDGDLHGNDEALHCSPDGLWVEPHPRAPVGDQRNVVTHNNLGGSVFASDTMTLTNPDAYDKHALFTLCGVIKDVPVAALGATHVLRFGIDDDTEEVVRQAMPYAPGNARLVPSIASTVRTIQVPAGSGMGTPDAPPALLVRFGQNWEARPTQPGPYGESQLIWSYVMG